jgi:hypothetical protein
MSTYSTSHRVNGPGQPLDERLRGYCWSHVPRVPRAIGYGPNKSGYDNVPSSGKWLGTEYPIPDMVLPLLAEGMGPPTSKN